jgi:large exoprotein involved in heme utilization and adhesion
LTADELHVSGGAAVASGTLGAADASPVDVVVSGLAEFSDDPLAGLTGVYSQVFDTAAAGSAGAVTLNAGELRLRSGGGVFSNSRGLGDAGDVRVVADTILIDATDSDVLTGIRSEALGIFGSGGDVRVEARGTLTLRGGGLIRVQNVTGGLQQRRRPSHRRRAEVVADVMLLDGTGAAPGSPTGMQAIGADAIPGELRVEAGELTIRNDAEITSLPPSAPRPARRLASMPAGRC